MIIIFLRITLKQVYTMGCSNTKEEQGTLLEQYAKEGLKQPWSGEYENEFEKKLFMAINLARHDPKRYVPYVKNAYKSNQLLKEGKQQQSLITRLQTPSTEVLNSLTFDEQANKACRANNEAKVAKDDAVPEKGGNIDKLNEMTGAEKNNTCEEYTMVKFEDDDAFNFVALELALDWEREGEEGQKSPILDANVTSVGISNKPHKACINIIQVLFIKSSQNVVA